MSTSSKFRLLVIGDLHSKISSLGAQVPSELIDQLKGVFSNAQQKPDAILVAGDITDSGASEEFAEASKFLNQVLEACQDQYGVKPVLYVVPGDHDCRGHEGQSVNWQAFEEFKSLFGTNIIAPSIDNENLQVEVGYNRLTKDDEVGKALDIYCLVSPTEAGSKESSPGTMGNSLPRIGNQQLEHLRNQLARDTMMGDRIRIALMYHAPLPCEQKLLGEKESIYDAGVLLSELQKNDFDLLVCGSSHRLHVTHYRTTSNGQTRPSFRWLDVIHSPSLAPDPRGLGNARAFLVLDILGLDSHPYARVREYIVAAKTPPEQAIELYKQHDWPDFVSTIWQGLPHNVRRHLFTPAFNTIMDAMRAPAAWSEMADIQRRFWKQQCRHSFKSLDEGCHLLLQGKLFIPAEHLVDQWPEFVQDFGEIERPGRRKFARFLSLLDLEFWDQAYGDDADESGRSNAARFYASPLDDLDPAKVDKHRLFLVAQEELSKPGTRRKFIEITSRMKSRGFKVSIVRRPDEVSRHVAQGEDETTKVRLDFTCFDDICVSRWEVLPHVTNDDPAHGLRALIENFSPLEIRRCARIWEQLEQQTEVFDDSRPADEVIETAFAKGPMELNIA